MAGTEEETKGVEGEKWLKISQGTASRAGCRIKLYLDFFFNHFGVTLFK